MADDLMGEAASSLTRSTPTMRDSSRNSPASRQISPDKEKDKKKNNKMKQVFHEWQLINKQEPIWLGKTEEITKDYTSFYKSLTNNWEDNQEEDEQHQALRPRSLHHRQLRGADS
ncbi:hypothetical protein HPP92_012500 [Vanilla planifolia]|uniref:Uncharacterized protein n=1 Tax=Vanilla planifolia TaxID=51239 RepID=A0A835QVA3_VANPL|nr:hypothetical protein HPP92_012500 [Vanilla planifolia]